ncbi:hypothetical protein PPYR_02872 [Photinus pyralis]|uniref:Methyltransferase type 11 domain-containing protein n=1 Tax=Photinus pyralis TaxID=7054 RepID=A0A5N4A168_PHOPY|nr:ubiquinone biosynthesis O-methyltransferase, mitochondrial-like [Photinus pyralis]KAB0791072.1 hypothetical protein PPYR_02872 [Photinus pyralis]
MSRVLKVSSADVGRNVYFTDHKSDWWDPNSWFKPLIEMNSLNLLYIQDVLREKGFVKDEGGFRLCEDLRILDVGCGGGLIAEPLARAGANILGIDINKDCIEAAEEHAKLDPCLKNLKYKWESIEAHSLENVEQYDVVILNFVLHHVKNHDDLIRDCLKTLKPGGVIFLSTISKNWGTWLRFVLVGEHIIRYVAPQSFDWHKFINFEDVQRILKQNKCDVENFRGISCDLVLAWIKWSDDTNNVYIMHANKHQ